MYSVVSASADLIEVTSPDGVYGAHSGSGGADDRHAHDEQLLLAHFDQDSDRMDDG